MEIHNINNKTYISYDSWDWNDIDVIERENALYHFPEAKKYALGEKDER